jgi:hypothetical protein
MFFEVFVVIKRVKKLGQVLLRKRKVRKCTTRRSYERNSKSALCCIDLYSERSRI